MVEGSMRTAFRRAARRSAARRLRASRRHGRRTARSTISSCRASRRGRRHQDRPGGASASMVREHSSRTPGGARPDRHARRRQDIVRFVAPVQRDDDAGDDGRGGSPWFGTRSTPSSKPLRVPPRRDPICRSSHAWCCAIGLFPCIGLTATFTRRRRNEAPTRPSLSLRRRRAGGCRS